MSCCCLFFFFKQKTAYEMRIIDWSSDVCSSDLKGDLFSIGFSVGAGIHAVERGTDGTNHLNVRLLRISADIVGFPWSAPCKHGMQRPGMILDIEPITYVAAVAIDRQWFASQGTDDDQRNKLFGEMIRSVIVGARSEEQT